MAAEDEIEEADKHDDEETTSNDREEADEDLDAEKALGISVKEIERLRLENAELRRQQGTSTRKGRGGVRMSSTTGGFGHMSLDSGGSTNITLRAQLCEPWCTLVSLTVSSGGLSRTITVTIGKSLTRWWISRKCPQ